MRLAPIGAAASSVQIRSRRICRSPESLTHVSSSGFSRLPPTCNFIELGYLNPCVAGDAAAISRAGYVLYRDPARFPQ
ncbi:hypothetical protein C9426_26635 [Serratia sp. S1B]|nr:hypothetical protein C9426_26635 [Serratia sp. S1B]